MRVVVWNVAHRVKALEALDELAPDIALLNEASLPASTKGLWRETTEGRDRARRAWSAAIITALPIEEISDARPSWRGDRPPSIGPPSP